MGVLERPKLGEILIRAGVIDDDQLRSALGEQSRWGGRLGIALIKSGYLTEKDLVRALASQLDLPVATLEGKRISRPILELVPADFAEQHNCLPLFMKEEAGVEVLYLGTDDPSNLDMLDDLSFRTGKVVKPVLVPPSELCEGIDRFYRDITPFPRVSLNEPPPPEHDLASRDTMPFSDDAAPPPPSDPTPVAADVHSRDTMPFAAAAAAPAPAPPAEEIQSRDSMPFDDEAPPPPAPDRVPEMPEVPSRDTTLFDDDPLEAPAPEPAPAQPDVHSRDTVIFEDDTASSMSSPLEPAPAASDVHSRDTTPFADEAPAPAAAEPPQLEEAEPAEPPLELDAKALQPDAEVSRFLDSAPPRIVLRALVDALVDAGIVDSNDLSKRVRKLQLLEEDL